MKQSNNQIFKDWKKIEEHFGIDAWMEVRALLTSQQDRIRELTISRNNWEQKYKLRNDDAKDYAKEITKLKKEKKK